MSKITQSYDRAVHSDYLIHWTGKDIDRKYQPRWYSDYYHFRRTDHQDIVEPYLDRLRDILTYGLWMTVEKKRTFHSGSSQITIPSTPQCCFTELRLSESRRHAQKFGRLGIGVKRPFLFERFGKPLTYFGYHEIKNDDKFLQACATDLDNQSLLNFFKPMNRTRDLIYDLYSESEWRILYFDQLLEEKKIIDPRDSANEKEHAYFNLLQPKQQRKLKYLIPLDGWFAMIIHPSGITKNLVHWDSKNGIADAITEIKRKSNDRGNIVEGLKNPTRGSWPLQIELDACRHF